MILSSKLYLKHSYLRSLVLVLKALLPQVISIFRDTPVVKLKKRGQLEVDSKFQYPILEVLDSQTLKCISCGLCEKACPTKCIEIVRSSALEINGSLSYGPPPEKFNIDIGKCIQCGFCQEVCPVGAISLAGDYNLLNLDGLLLGIVELKKQAKLPKEEF